MENGVQGIGCSFPAIVSVFQEFGEYGIGVGRGLPDVSGATRPPRKLSEL